MTTCKDCKQKVEHVYTRRRTCAHCTLRRVRLLGAHQGLLQAQILDEAKGGNVKKLFSSLPTLPSPLVRFLRVVAGAALAAGITAAIGHVGELPISDASTVALLTAGLVALDKFCRDKGVY